MNESFTDWDQLIEEVRPWFDTLLDTQRMPEMRRVNVDTGDVYPCHGQTCTVPDGGAPVSQLMSDIIGTVLARGYCNGAHPHYFGYFHPRPLPVAVLGDSIAALLNQSPAAWRMGAAATAMETETLDWIADFIGYKPRESTTLPAGIFTSGGTMANISALKMARDVAFGETVRDQGMRAVTAQGTFYVSAERHYSLSRALDMIGAGRQALRIIATDREGRIAVPALRQAIEQDRLAGCQPVAVIGLAGTTATGAVDPLDQLADVAREYAMWFHVDGAAAAVFADQPPTRALFTGLAQADSVTLDPHKWLFLSYGLGCLLVRDPAQLQRSFHEQAHYWHPDERPDFVFLGPEGARGWRSLGLWLAMRQLGRQGYSRLLQSNLQTARYLAAQVAAAENLELLAQPQVPVCCFRAVPARQGVNIDAWNQALHQALIKQGDYYLTLCYPQGQCWLRVSVNNYTTDRHHIDALLRAVQQQCREPDAEV